MRMILLIALLVGPFYTSAQGYRSARFIYEGSDAKMIKALRLADSVMTLPAFWRAVAEYPDQHVDNSSYTMRMLADTLQAFSGTSLVKRIGGIHPRATAKTGARRISITGKGYRQDLSSLAVTLVHEWVHAVDFAIHQPGKLAFAHFSNQDRCLNRNTASYRIERVMEKLLGNADFALGCR